MGNCVSAGSPPAIFGAPSTGTHHLCCTVATELVKHALALYFLMSEFAYYMTWWCSTGMQIRSFEYGGLSLLWFRSRGKIKMNSWLFFFWVGVGMVDEEITGTESFCLIGKALLLSLLTTYVKVWEVVHPCYHIMHTRHDPWEGSLLSEHAEKTTWHGDDMSKTIFSEMFLFYWRL